MDNKADNASRLNARRKRKVNKEEREQMIKDSTEALQSVKAQIDKLKTQEGFNPDSEEAQKLNEEKSRYEVELADADAMEIDSEPIQNNTSPIEQSNNAGTTIGQSDKADTILKSIETPDNTGIRQSANAGTFMNSIKIDYDGENLLDDIDTASDTPDGRGLAFAGRLGVVYVLGDDTASAKYVFGPGDGEGLPDITDTSDEAEHRLCDRKKKKNEYYGKKADFDAITGVVWDYRGKSEEEALKELDPVFMKKTDQYTTMKDRKTYQKNIDKDHRLKTFPTAYVIVRWKTRDKEGRTIYTFESASGVKRMWRDDFVMEKKIYHAACSQVQRYKDSQEGRPRRETSNLFSRDVTPAADVPSSTSPSPAPLPTAPPPATMRQPLPEPAKLGISTPSPTPESQIAPPGAISNDAEKIWIGYWTKYCQTRGWNINNASDVDEMMVRADFDGKLANMAARKQAAQPTTS